MMKTTTMKVFLVFFIFVTTSGTAILAPTTRYSKETRSKINCVIEKISSRTIFIARKRNLKIASYSTIHRARRLVSPDQVLTISGPEPEIFNGTHAISTTAFKLSLNNLPGIFIPPRSSL